MNINELRALNVKELQDYAKKIGEKDIAGFKKQDLIKVILENQAKSNTKKEIFSSGVLEILPDGYGFLRSANYCYLPSSDDIYVSHSQIKRFGLKTGHFIEGQVRPPKDNERFFALLRVEKINQQNPDKAKHNVRFVNLTPLFPEEQINLEIHPKEYSTRIIDLLSPIG